MMIIIVMEQLVMLTLFVAVVLLVAALVHALSMVV